MTGTGRAEKRSRGFIAALTLLVVASSGWAAASAWSEVVAPGIRVLFDEPAIEGYAQSVAGRAVVARQELADLFDTEPPEATIQLDARTDVYSAIAPPLPRPRVSLPALFPATSQVDLSGRDPLYELLLHELTHSVQLSYLDRPDGVSRLPRLGLVGEAVAPVPPGWLLEGLAVWVARSLAPRAGSEQREQDARTRGVLHALALEGEWPSLDDISLLSHRQWPGGEARYLLGGAFVGELVEEYGWETILLALRQANAGWYPLSFSSAWHRTTGDDLESVWRRWSVQILSQASERLSSLQPERGGVPLTNSGSASTVLAVSPNGELLAWRPAGGGLLISPLAPEGLADSRRLLPQHIYPQAVTWLPGSRLAYTRLAPGADDRYLDLFELDLETGEETRRTFGERVRFPSANPGGCIWYVRDVVSEGSELRRLCRGEPQRMFVAPEGTHIVGVAAGGANRVALSIWRNGFVDLALLDDGRLLWLTQDPAQDLDPVWWGDRLIFRSDRGPVFELYSLRPGERELVRLTESVGGAFGPGAGGGRLVFARLGGDGFGLAQVTPTGAEADPSASNRIRLRDEPLPQPTAYDRLNPVREYVPGASLLPYGWAPEIALRSLSPLELAGAVSVLGQDRSGDHSYAIRVGYDPRLGGAIPGAWANLSYDYRVVNVLDRFQRPPPTSFGVSVGTWPWNSGAGSGVERAVGGQVEFRVRGFERGWASLARVRLGLFLLPSHGEIQPDARADLVLSRRASDLWGYGVRGPRLSLHAAWRADASGGSPSAWLDASSVFGVGGSNRFSTEVALRGGLGPRPPVPVEIAGAGAVASFTLRDSIDVAWRYQDGLVAIERLTLEGRFHGLHDGSLSVAADASLWLDAMLRYGAPVSVGGAGGYARGWWYRLGLRLPL